MKYLIVYHSESGNNRKLAEAIFNKMREEKQNVSIRRLMPKRSILLPIRGLLGVLRCQVALSELYQLTEDDEFIILCGPVWAGGLSPALRSFIVSQHKLSGKKFYPAFCCFTNAAGAFKELEQKITAKSGTIVRKETIAVENLRKKRKLDNFVNNLVQKCVSIA